MAAFTRLSILAIVCACAAAQYAEERAPRYVASSAQNKEPVTPVPILKQINRHNEDGSYTYGYEGADGSFKIETKSAEGEVKGKYGYRDDTGKLRVVEYGANKFGFQPAGEGITVAPPTLVDESRQEDERQSKKQSNRNRPVQQQSLPDYDYEEPAPTPARPAPRAQPAYRAPAQQAYRAPAPAQQAYRAPAAQTGPAPPKPQFFSGAAPAPLDQSTFFSPAPSASPPRAPKQQQAGFTQFQQFQPQGQIEYTQNQNSFAAAQPRYQAQPSQYQAQPSQYQAQPSQPKPQQPFSMLDQLLKEFALPPGGSAPLHDITFGSY